MAVDDSLSPLLSRARALSSKLSTIIKRETGERDDAAQAVRDLEKSLNEARVHPESCSEDLDSVEAVLAGLRKWKVVGGKPSKRPALLSALLGDAVPLITLQYAQSIRLKEEYHAFRDKMTMLRFFFPLALLLAAKFYPILDPESHEFALAPPTVTGVQLLLVAMTYSYVAMALRESVLLVNGSNIRPWWIQHQYWSAAVCLLMLSLPVDSPAVHRMVISFLKWTTFQAVVMWLQNRYQRKRMYKRAALGKSNAMDVVGGETSGIAGQLLLLYPLLWGLQAWQLYLGVEMMLWNYSSVLNDNGWVRFEHHEDDLRGSRGILIVGAMLAMMAVLNFANTTATFIAKQKHGRGGVKKPAARSGKTAPKPPRAARK